jgi:hypothetical protein
VLISKQRTFVGFARKTAGTGLVLVNALVLGKVAWANLPTQLLGFEMNKVGGACMCTNLSTVKCVPNPSSTIRTHCKPSVYKYLICDGGPTPCAPKGGALACAAVPPSGCLQTNNASCP